MCLVLVSAELTLTIFYKENIGVVLLCRDQGVVEDAAQGLGAKYKGDGIGTFDKGATISFYPAKNLGSFGDGGAFVTNDKKMYDR